ncbi:MAG: hypothetical protein ABIP33_06535 [Pseudolysinimonas sp.]
MNWIKDNLTGLLSFLVVVLTAVQGLKDFGLISDLQLAALIISSAIVIVVPLVKVAWAGALKTSLDLVGAAIVILIPFIALWVMGTPVTKDAVVLIILAFVKAGATEFGIQVRTDWGSATPKALAARA